MTHSTADPPDALPDIDWAIDRLSKQAVPVRTTSPDLLGQLRQARDLPLRRIVCIGIDTDAQCDLMANTLRTRRAEVDRGLAMLAKWFDVKLLRIEAAAAEYDYPNLLPEMLVRRLTRKKLAFGELPTQAGVLILDALSAATVLSPLAAASPTADDSGETNITRSAALPVIVDDYVLRRRFHATVDAGVTVAEVLAQASVDVCTVNLLHGPLVANAPVDPNTPVGRTDLWFHAQLPSTTPPAACTRCGECVSVCPVHLHPAALLEAAQVGSAKMARKFHALNCIECGLCTAVCPSSLPVKLGVAAAKRLVA